MSLTARVNAARSEAFREAKGSSPWVFSRGAYVATIDEHGEQCSPWPGADPMNWNGKLSSLPDLIAKAAAHPHVWRVVLEGGYDGADTMEGRKAGNYEPWIASWSVELWNRRTA